MNTKKIMIAGNWKMHLNVQQASLLVHRLNQGVKVHRDIEIVLAPSMLALQPVSLEIDRRKFKLAAQDADSHDEGAYTGQVSFTMLREIIEYAIIGHSERRAKYDETLEIVRDKIAACVRNEIKPILCIGETAEERANNETKRVIHDQITTALMKLTPEEVEHVTIAYEPVWSIGSGAPAKPDEIASVLIWVRSIIHDLFGAQQATDIRVLYGGSVEPDFAAGLLAVQGLDGFLVGGASLLADKFISIIDTTYATVHADSNLDHHHA